MTDQVLIIGSSNLAADPESELWFAGTESWMLAVRAVAGHNLHPRNRVMDQDFKEEDSCRRGTSKA